MSSTINKLATLILTQDTDELPVGDEEQTVIRNDPYLPVGEITLNTQATDKNI